MSNDSVELLHNLAVASIERERLHKLSNEELVKECSVFVDLGDLSECELYLEELMNRVWPEWEQMEI